MKEILLFPITFPVNLFSVLLFILFRGEMDLSGSVMFLVIQSVVTTLVVLGYIFLTVYVILNIL